MNVAPDLVPEIVEPILVLTVRLVAAAGPNASLMLNPLAATFNLDPVARCILPKLPHAWPLEIPAKLGRLDVLEKARLLQLIPSPRSLATTTAIPAIISAAIQQDAGHAHVLRWVAKHWPKQIAASIEDARLALRCAADWAERGVDMLNFWTYEATADGTSDRKLLYETIFATRNVRTAQERAFTSRNPSVIQWWADHSHLNWEVGAHWNADWIDLTLMNGWVDVVGVSADLEEAGKVRFYRPLAVVSPSAFGIVQVLAQDPQGEVVEGTLIRVADTILDYASDYGVVEALRFWKQRHGESKERKSVPLVYTEHAMDRATTPEVLDWWLEESGLPLKYTFRAIHYATSNGKLPVLDWWLAQYRAGHIEELKYNGWIMTIASVSCAFDRETGAVTGTYKDDKFPAKRRAAILDWWDKSGLDLKLPQAPQDSNGRHNSADSSIPSPIDLCTYPNVLGWWLNRARRLHALHPPSTLQSHFPYYSTTAIHRAAYRCSTRTLEWWFRYGGAPAGLELRYSPHRPMELAAMTSMSAFPSALEWWCTSLPIKFRGDLLEWARFRPAPAMPGFTQDEVTGGQVPREWELERLRGLCMRFGIKVDGGGGLPPPDGGYVKQEVGEEFVFFPLVS